MRHDPWFWRVKAAQRDLIERCGGVRRAAEVAGCSHGWIGKCNTPTEDAFLSLPQKRALEADAGEPVVTQVEAELQDFQLMRNGLASGAVPASPYAAVAALSEEYSEVLAEFARRTADGDFSRADGAALDRDLADLIARAEAFRRFIAAQAAGSAGA